MMDADYRDMHIAIRTLIDRLKADKNVGDSEVGKMIGLKGETLRNYRMRGTFPSMQFCKVMELADQAGFEVKFVRKEGLR